MFTGFKPNDMEKVVAISAFISTTNQKFKTYAY